MGEEYRIMPPEGIVLLLNDIFNVDCHFCERTSPEKLYPDPRVIFAGGQYPTPSENAELVQKLKPQELTVIVDRLMITWLMMRSETHLFLVGPFQAFPASPTLLGITLEELLPGKSSLSAFYEYRAALPSIEDNWMRSLVRVFSRAVCGNADPEMNWVELYKSEMHSVPGELSFNTYAQSAYEIESEYLEAVYRGSSQDAVDALHKIQSRYRKRAFSDPNRLTAGIYGNAINCTLARTAAYQAGVSPVILDEIFQEQMALAITGKDVEEQFKQAFRMTNAVCEQVQLVKTGSFSSLIRQAVCYLLDHYRQSVRLEQIADILGVHKNYLSNLFKKETGKRFIEYLNDIRLEQASVKIRLSSQSIGEIAASVGIQDQNYFARMFQKKYGVTPSEWRK